MSLKTCTNCNVEKNIDLFYKRNLNPISRCKECYLLKIKEYRKNNKEVIKIRKRNRYLKDRESEDYKKKAKEYRKNNKDNSKKYFSKYRENNLDKIKEYYRQYYIKNKEKIISNVIKYKSNRKKNDMTFNLAISLRRLISNSINRMGYTKRSKTQIILGCSFEEFKLYIENKFEPWMNWDNKGLYNGEINYGWDIDHIVPISSAKNEKEVILLNNYTNLQPLCSKINRDIKKSN